MDIKNIVQWCVGLNNIQAMYDVANDKYGYNFAGTASQFDRLKQYGTESLHLAPKWYLLARAIDFGMGPVKDLLGIPRDTSVGFLDNIVTVENGVFVFAALSTSTVGLAYISPKLANLLGEAQKMSSRDPINIAMKRLTTVGKEALNITSLSLPIFIGYKQGGYFGALIATIPAHIVESELQRKIPRNAARFKPFVLPAFAATAIAASYLVS